MIPDRIRELIEKYTSNTLTPQEREELHVWYQRKAQQDVPWELNQPQDQVQLDQRMYQRIQSSIHPPSRPSGLTTFGWLKAAALVLLVFSAGLYFWSSRNSDESLLFSNENVAGNRFVLLPDSSKVILKPHSHLKVTFSDTMRVVELQGEAFFDVTHSSQAPFVVHTDGFRTRVLGTQFLVKANKDFDLTVSVKQGKVAVFKQDQPQELGVLHAHEGLQISKGGGDGLLTTRTTKLNTQEVNRDLLWVQNELKFTGITLQELVQRLANRYHVPIRVNEPELRASRINGSFDGTETLESILKTITQLTDTKLSKQEETYIINGKTHPK